MLLDGVLAATRLDRESLPQSRLNISRRERTNPLPWTGQFSPQLAEALLATYASDDAVVLDPFVGSGTVLLEAGRLGLRAYGVELNPAAVMLSRVYELVRIDPVNRRNLVDHLGTRIREELRDCPGPLFSGVAVPAHGEPLEGRLVRLCRRATAEAEEILLAALIVLSDFRKKDLSRSAVHRAWARLRDTVLTLPESAATVSVLHADARDLPLEPHLVDLVLTSPPYINVLNYHQKYRRSVEALEWDVLRLARSEIGSNRKNRGNRFLTVIDYCLDMTLALAEAMRVTKRGGTAIWVVGRESKVRGTTFFNGELIAEIAVRGLGAQLRQRQERVFQNRYGQDIYEDILHFEASTPLPDRSAGLAAARRVAADALQAAYPLAPRAARPGLREALEKVDDVRLSPIMTTEVPARAVH